ncbi:MAG: CHAT domain-containing protein, partial [Bacteroidota bacterium]
FNPDYYRLKYGVEPLEIKALQNQIPNPSTRLVEYYLDSLNVYIFVIDQGKLSAWQLPHAEELESLVRAVRSEHEAVLSGQTGDPAFYAKQLARLYEILIAPWAQNIEPEASWVIVPHGVLHYLSFETLLPEAQTAWGSAPFLLQQVDIQYAWSADFWGRPPAPKQRSAEGFLGFAPTFGTAEDQVALRAKFAPLPNAVGEVQHAADLFAGQLFQGFLASEANYYQYAKEASIIHLATHSVADDAFPMQSGFWLSMDNDTLEDGFLNALEIYNYPLQADLVVLSACNTGYGKLAQGEGVMSLGRAFSYAGSESLLMSLWVANDLATSTILNGFYEGLAAGNPKQMALQKAKRDYLEKADPLTAHPAYWSHLIFLGNPQPLSAPWGMMNWLMIGGLGLLIGSVLLFWFRGAKT